MKDEREKGIIQHRTDDGEEGAFTYRKLLAKLQQFSDQQLDQPVQVLPPHPTPDPVRLEPVYGIGTVEEMCHVDGEICTETRSSQDFQHHPEEVILLRDYSPFSKDGDSFYTMQDDGSLVGNKSGKVVEGPLSKPRKKKKRK